MKKFAFVSDFDGTLTIRDFYHIIIDKYFKDWGKSFYEEWRKTKKINVEFLNIIFSKINKSEKEILEEIYLIPFDENAKAFIKKVQANEGDFFILSAGTSYYIEILLKHLNIQNVKVISMRGEYFDGGIKIFPDEKNKYYSDVFGIDKRKVILDLKKEYEFVCFAGDSEPDKEAAKVADIAFAKSDLIDILQKDNFKFIPVKDFKQIDNYLMNSGWFD